jgi:hypothetical protein
MDVTAAERLIFAARHRVVLDAAPAGDGAAVARQLDAVLMCAGFKCSRQLLEQLAACEPDYLVGKAVQVIEWARELAGDHVQHNTYFIDFPQHVPDTLEFWSGLLADAIRQHAKTGHAKTGYAKTGYAKTGYGGVEGILGPDGVFALNLLSLPGYGRYLHTFGEMLARHDELIPALSDRVTILHPGGPLADEAAELFGELAASTVPLSGERLDWLRQLADMSADATVFPEYAVPEVPEVPVRENLAVINAARVRAGQVPSVATPTDVLRLAAELSGGDVTLRTPTRFRSLPRRQRRLLLAALGRVAEGRLGDVGQYAEPWKRLGERLHPHESGSPAVAAVFAVARGEQPAPSLAARAEAAFADGNVQAAATVLAQAPGLLWRSADRLLRGARPADTDALLAQFERTAPQVSGRVLLSVREHLATRKAGALQSGARDIPRIFANRQGRGFVVPDTRAPLGDEAVAALLAVIDTQIAGRLPAPGHLVIDPAILGVALPLSGKPTPEGLAVFPRGSVTRIGAQEILRFFLYWREGKRRTDYDLSAVFTDENFANDSFVAYTALRNEVAEHSGDIVEAPTGASEFINVHVDRIASGYVIPQVYVYAGEGFGEVAENFFGFLTLDEAQLGAPYEPRLVRTKSALHGTGRTAIPLVFYRGQDGSWWAKWLHFYLRGTATWSGGVRVEENKLTVKILARSVLARDYLRVDYLAGLLRAKADAVTVVNGSLDGVLQGEAKVTYLGVTEPPGLPDGSAAYTLGNLAALIPA